MSINNIPIYIRTIKSFNKQYNLHAGQALVEVLLGIRRQEVLGGGHQRGHNLLGRLLAGREVPLARRPGREAYHLRIFQISQGKVQLPVPDGAAVAPQGLRLPEVDEH